MHLGFISGKGEERLGQLRSPAASVVSRSGEPLRRRCRAPGVRGVDERTAAIQSSLVKLFGRRGSTP